MSILLSKSVIYNKKTFKIWLYFIEMNRNKLKGEFATKKTPKTKGFRSFSKGLRKG